MPRVGIWYQQIIDVWLYKPFIECVLRAQSIPDMTKVIEIYSKSERFFPCAPVNHLCLESSESTGQLLESKGSKLRLELAGYGCIGDKEYKIKPH